MAKKNLTLPSAATITAAVVDDLLGKRPSRKSASAPTIPTQPVLTKEEAALSREFHRESGRHWSRLTQEQQDAWDQYAKTHTPQTPDNGYWLFRAAQFERQAMGLPLTYEAPMLPPPPAPAYAEILAGSDPETAYLYISHPLMRLGGYKCRISIAAPGEENAAKTFRPISGLSPESYIDLPRSGKAALLISNQFSTITAGLLRIQMLTIEGIIGGEITCAFNLAETRSHCASGVAA